METRYRETTKYIKIYTPTGKTGNENSGIEMKKVVLNKETNKIRTSRTFISNSDIEQFLLKSESEISTNYGPILAKALLENI